ncbi:MAG: TolC family protein [Pirellulaceae bacterium]
MSVAQLERGMVDFVDNIINQYWQLYFAYKNLDAIHKAFDSAQATWEMTKARYDNESPG